MESTTVSAPAYAKLNFTLDVLSKRADGFHSIATVMQTISLSDVVTVSLREGRGITVECSDPSIPTDSQNLAYRAADLMMQRFRIEAAVTIQIEKRIPSAAGLGGGSSDAAATLRGLWFATKQSGYYSVLSPLAAEIGSDVPYFLCGGTASCRGRGERVTPLWDARRLWFVVVKPERRTSTAEAYEALDALPNRVSARATRSMERAISPLKTPARERITARMTNDFEQWAFSEYMDLALLHDELMMARACAAHLCGSGSAVFGVAWSEEEANETARIMRLKYERVFVCHSVNRLDSQAVGNPVL